MEVEPKSGRERAWAALRPAVLVAIPPLCVWVWLCAERPWRLGFYCDDWLLLLHPKAGSLAAFTDILTQVQSRPVSAPFYWAAQAFIDWSPVRAQLLCVLALSLVAGAVGLLAHQLSKRAGLSPGASMCAVSVAATAFICFPSTLGTFAWGVGMLAVSPAIILFCLGMSLLIGSHSERVSVNILAMALLLSSHLAYEALYFQEIIVFAISLALSGQTLPTRRQVLVVGALIAINLAALAFNRLAPGPIQRQFNPDWWHLFAAGYSHIIGIFGHATREAQSLVKVSFLVSVALGYACVAFVVGLRAAVTVAALFLVGGAMAGVLYAMAGYGVAAEGVMARSANVMSVYSALAAGLLSAAAFAQIGLRRGLAVAQLGATAALLVAFSVTSHARLQDWAATWTAEVERLASLPRSYKFIEGDSRIYLALEPSAPLRPISIAVAPWEINGAIAWELYVRSGYADRDMMEGAWHGHGRWYGGPPDWFNEWDGQRLEQGFCQSRVPIFHATGTELWVWRRDDAIFAPVESGWSTGCEGSAP